MTFCGLVSDLMVFNGAFLGIFSFFDAGLIIDSLTV